LRKLSSSDVMKLAKAGWTIHFFCNLLHHLEFEIALDDQILEATVLLAVLFKPFDVIRIQIAKLLAPPINRARSHRGAWPLKQPDPCPLFAKSERSARP